MTNKYRAMLWFLSDTDESELDWRLQDLEESASDNLAAMVVNVWKPFEDITVEQLLSQIDKLETAFDECQHPLLDRMNKAKEMIRDLRDGPGHFCPATENEDDKCSCREYDNVIDIL